MVAIRSGYRIVARACDWLLPFLWVGAIMVVGNANVVPVRGTEPLALFFRKLIHVAAYAFVSMLFSRALAPQRGRISLGLGIAPAIGLTVASGGLDEWQQALVPGRAPRLSDMGFDTVGAVLGFWWIARYRRYSAREGASAQGWE